MGVPSRLQIGIAVTLATIVICSLGVIAELKIAGQSTHDQGSRAQSGAAAAQAPDAARNNQP